MLEEHNPPKLLTVNLGSYNVMVDGYCVEKRFDEAVNMFKRYEISKGIKQNPVVSISSNIPDQCSPIHLNLVARHGTRAPSVCVIRFTVLLKALVTLKKGTQLIYYCRKGRPKFRPFRLSPPVFKRYRRPEKEYLSFSLIYKNGERSLDLICKDNVEVEICLAGLRHLISPAQSFTRRTNNDLSDFHDGSSYTIQNGYPFGLALEFTSTRGSVSVDSRSSENNFITTTMYSVPSERQNKFLILKRSCNFDTNCELIFKHSAKDEDKFLILKRQNKFLILKRSRVPIGETS